MCDYQGLLLYASMLFFLHLGVIKKNYFILCFGISFSSFISSIRGYAGIDTYVYRSVFDNSLTGLEGLAQLTLLEPILPLIIIITKSFGLGFSSLSLIISLIIGYMYFWILKKFPNAIYFSLALFPALYIDSIFNGIRVGLAYPTLFVSIALSSTVFLIIAFLIHFTSLIALPFINKKNVFLLFISFIFIFLLGGNELINPIFQRFIFKSYQYQTVYSQNFFSGLADSFMLAVSLICFFRIRGIQGKTYFFIIPLIIFTTIIFQYLFASQFVFFLRLLRLLTVTIFAICASLEFSKIKLDIYYLCLIFGALYSLNFLRQINNTCEYPKSTPGFLPLIENMEIEYIDD